MNEVISLNALPVGQCGIVRKIETQGSMRRRLLDIGLVENTYVECVGRSPGGDPSAYRIRGTVIAIRAEDCHKILIQTGKEGIYGVNKSSDGDKGC